MSKALLVFVACLGASVSHAAEPEARWPDARRFTPQLFRAVEKLAAEQIVARRHQQGFNKQDAWISMKNDLRGLGTAAVYTGLFSAQVGDLAVGGSIRDYRCRVTAEVSTQAYAKLPGDEIVLAQLRNEYQVIAHADVRCSEL